MGTNNTEFSYDAKNRVVKRTVNGVASYLTYDGWSLIEERNAAGTLQTRYVHGTQTDEMISKTDANGAVYCSHDGLGSTTMLTNASGVVVEKYSYDVYGKVTITSQSNSLQPSSLFGNRFFYTGREYIKEVGLYDYRNRVYSESLGRFLQTDPIRFEAGDVNIYRYVGNNGVNAIDPMGDVWANVAGAVAGGVGAAVGANLSGAGAWGTLGASLTGAVGGFFSPVSGFGSFFGNMGLGAGLGWAAGSMGNLDANPPSTFILAFPDDAIPVGPCDP